MHPTLNGALTAAEISAHTHWKVWWLCVTDPAHSWEASVSNRTRLSVGCPYCLSWVSKPQLRLHAELRWIFNGSGVRFNQPTYRVGKLDPDIHISGPILRARGCKGVAVMYDGKYWHAGKLEHDRDITARLRAAGRLVLRVREHPLRPCTEFDLVHPGTDVTKTLVDRVAEALVASDGPFKLPNGRLLEYRRQADLQATGLADKLITLFWKPDNRVSKF